jgi:hypothetical protein
MKSKDRMPARIREPPIGIPFQPAGIIPFSNGFTGETMGVIRNSLDPEATIFISPLLPFKSEQPGLLIALI